MTQFSNDLFDYTPAFSAIQQNIFYIAVECIIIIGACAVIVGRWQLAQDLQMQFWLLIA